jgi:hypothetical protein
MSASVGVSPMPFSSSSSRWRLMPKSTGRLRRLGIATRSKKFRSGFATAREAAAI